MEWPLVTALNLDHATELALAAFVGVGFGFTLERGGFGRADNMAAIFYGRDFRVMRVIFSSVVTAMLGLYFLDLSGTMPLGNIGLMPTYLLPQLVGGVLFGVGFVIGGYCPGTSVVASMSGKVDALFFVGGLFGGTLLFTMAYSLFERFHNITAMGRVLLHEYFGIPSGVMVFAVALFAVGALYAVGRIEAVVRARVAAREGQA